LIAGLQTRDSSVNADVELLAIQMRIGRMGDNGTIHVVLLFFGASETIFQDGFDLRTASFTLSFLGPGTFAALFIEDQISGAGEVALFTINARKHDVASGWVGMLEHTVSSGAVTNRLWGLESFTSGAVDEAGQVALVVSAFERVEDESILTEHLLSLTVDTDVVFVALFFMDVLAITSWALELGGSQNDGAYDEEESSCVLHVGSGCISPCTLR